MVLVLILLKSMLEEILMTTFMVNHIFAGLNQFEGDFQISICGTGLWQ